MRFSFVRGQPLLTVIVNGLCVFRGAHTPDFCTTYTTETAPTAVALFLDGFDEMPESVRSEAVAELNKEVRIRIVLTSTVTAFNAATQTSNFTYAAAIDLCSVGAQTAASYLLVGQSAVRRQKWERLVSALEASPTGAAARTLTGPLTLSLVRKVYAERGDPCELLDVTLFPDRRRHRQGRSGSQRRRRVLLL